MTDFKSWKVPALRTYLIERGVTVTGHQKAVLIAICENVTALNLPTDPDFAKCPGIKETIEAKLSKLDCNFSDPLKLNGFTADLSNGPTITLRDIFNYLVCSVADLDGQRLQAWKSFNDTRLTIDGHVLKLELNDTVDPKFAVYRAQVKPTQRDTVYTNKHFYEGWFIIEKQTNIISLAYCECKGGADGACRHVSAALHELQTWFEKTKSCTEGPMQWVRRARPSDEPCPLADLPVKKIKTAADNIQQNGRQLEEFDIRHPDDREPPAAEYIRCFAANLKAINKNTSVLELLEESDEDTETTQQDSHQQIDGPMLDNISIKQKIKQVPYFDASHDKELKQAYENFLQCQSYSPAEIEIVETATRGQSHNPLWHSIRAGLITASNFHRVASKSETLKKNPSTDTSALLKTLTGQASMDETKLPAALAWGRENETDARSLYEQFLTSGHKHVKIEESGLFLSKDNVFLACSPDGIVSCECDCHGNNKWLLEIKCPYTMRDMHPNEAAIKRGCSLDRDNWVLSRTHQYYSQIQGQLGICGIDKCVLVVYTNKGILPILVPFDEELYSIMLKKLTYFAKNYLFPYLIKMFSRHDQ